MALTNDDLSNLASKMREVVKEEITEALEPMAVAIRKDFDAMETQLSTMQEGVDRRLDRLVTGTDAYLKKTETWKQEQDVLRLHHGRLQTALVKKGVVSEQELGA